jgi:hypothetical protein
LGSGSRFSSQHGCVTHWYGSKKSAGKAQLKYEKLNGASQAKLHLRSPAGNKNLKQNTSVFYFQLIHKSRFILVDNKKRDGWYHLFF